MPLGIFHEPVTTVPPSYGYGGGGYIRVRVQGHRRLLISFNNDCDAAGSCVCRYTTVLVINVLAARSLRAADMNGRSDPYAKIKLISQGQCEVHQ